jgi:hypothetical protein
MTRRPLPTENLFARWSMLTLRRKRTMPTRPRRIKEPDWKLVLADIRRTERDVAEAQELVGAFRETLDVVKKRLVFIRTRVERRARLSR